MMRFNDKVVLITGGGGGIGKAAARRFLDEGASVVLGSRRQAVLDAAREELAEYGDRVAVYAGDASGQAQAQELVDYAVETYGRVDVVVNSTGIFRVVPFLEQTEEAATEPISKMEPPPGIAARLYLQPRKCDRRFTAITVSQSFGCVAQQEPAADSRIEHDAVEAPECLGCLAEHRGRLIFIGCVGDDHTGFAAFPPNELGRCLCPSLVDIGDTHRRSLPREEETHRTAVADWRVVDAVVVLASAHDQHASPLHPSTPGRLAACLGGNRCGRFLAHLIAERRSLPG